MTDVPDPELADDENPVWDKASFDRARRAEDVLPGLVGTAEAAAMLARRGRPRSAAVKEHLSLRLDADVVQGFRSTGPGWQTRLNAALREWLASHAADQSIPRRPRG